MFGEARSLTMPGKTQAHFDTQIMPERQFSQHGPTFFASSAQPPKMGSLHLLTIAVAALAPLMPKVASIAAAAKPMVQ